MAVKWLDPGGKATQDFSLFTASNVGNVTPTWDGTAECYKFACNVGGTNRDGAYRREGLSGIDSGRFMFDFEISASPSNFVAASNDQNYFFQLFNGSLQRSFSLQMDATRHIVLWDRLSVTLATGSTALAINTRYRLTVAWIITNATAFQIKVFIDGVQEFSITNGGDVRTSLAVFAIGPENFDSTGAAVNLFYNDIYLDDSNGLSDPGDIGITAKRPFANGTLNEFTTQIGAGNSGYGSGHADEVNERPLSETNGWSIQDAALKVEEYTLEAANAGDDDLTGMTIVDFMGWLRAKVGSASTGNIILAGAATNISLDTSYATFVKMAASSTYPSTGAAIGMDTNTVNQLFSLAECGVIVAYTAGGGGDEIVPISHYLATVGGLR